MPTARAITENAATTHITPKPEYIICHNDSSMT